MGVLTDMTTEGVQQLLPGQCGACVGAPAKLRPALHLDLGAMLRSLGVEFMKAISPGDCQLQYLGRKL